jgi:LPXTG-site transpeptidase (sortase) family protein
MKNRAWHRRINDGLSVAVAGLAVYIIVSPLVPLLSFWWAQKTDKTDGFVYASSLAASEAPAVKVENLKPPPVENRLVIPVLKLDQEIYEGPHANTLSKGVWRKPHTSTPDKGSNTVLAGHRFSYSDPSVFYNLDKLKPGDRFSVYWQSREIAYEVNAVRVVSPLAVEIEMPTSESRLTIYTCTPVWSSRDRLVITANPIEELL